MPTAVDGPFFVDAHVHLHPCFDVPRFLDAALDNVERAAQSAGLPASEPVGILLLTEGAGEGAFERLRQADTAGARGFGVDAGIEPGVLWLSRDGRRRLLVIAGRQVVTAEGVEVLALLSPGAPDDGTPLAACLTTLARTNAVAVLPWGFGKWRGRRGRLVAEQLRAGHPSVLAGDNGGRLALAPTPTLLAEAKRCGIPVLPGSDPLPFPDQEQRVGSCGFIADVALPVDRPAAALRAWLQALDAQPRRYGALRGILPFCWDQGRMQWRKRVARRHRVRSR